MKREGRQHGMVRSIQILPSPLTSNPGQRFVNELNSIPTAGVFTKVSRKPTNHSKFTGKCGQPRCVDCHKRPVCKSKKKAKGSHKVKVIRSTDSESTGFDYSGFSATRILDHLGDYGSDYVDYYHEDDVVVEEIKFESNLGKDIDVYVDEGADEDEDTDEGWYLVTEM